MRSVHARWKNEVAKADCPVLVFSPYLTSRAAESALLLMQDRSLCEVYTLFDPEVFVTGASSIGTLRRLSRGGVELYAMPDIHAKMVIVKGTFASVGSQNLTRGGQLRREATFTTTDGEEVNHIWEAALVWCRNRRVITPEMIDDMERAVRPLVRRFRLIQTLCHKVADEIATRQEQRQAELDRMESLRAELDRKAEEERIAAEWRRREEERVLEAEAARRRQREEAERANRERQAEELRRLQGVTSSRWKANDNKSQEQVPARVCQVGYQDRYHSITYRYSLIPTIPANLTRWTMRSGQEAHLMRLYRYPCLIHGSWKLGFVRVARRCITFIERLIEWSQPVVVGGLSWKISYQANWEGFEGESNLTCTIESFSNRWSIKIPAWFHLDDLDLRAPMVEPKLGSDAWAGKALAWYEHHRADVKGSLLRQLLQPFVYKDKLTGGRANAFLGSVGTDFTLQAVQIEGCPILVTRVD